MNGVIAPLGALFRHANGPRPAADEILVLSFNHDLAFFEKAALGVAQMTGARITVVADAAMAHHDVYAVRRAGTACLPGLAYCTGSFHPKLIVIASGERATVGIGSGNLSMAGWQGNDELWSWHYATADSGSAVVRATGRWLRELTGAVKVARPVAEALRRIGALLATFPEDDETCRLVDTVSGPIVDQLPVGPVDELNLYAPFYDPHASALRSLIDRLQPAVVRIGYQPTMTRINGVATVAALGPSGETRELSEGRYRHGKLIEWSTGGRRWALTGSANISAAALLSGVKAGGNVELGVIAPVTGSLMPAGTVATESHLATIPYRGMAPATGPAAVILAATRSPSGVEVEFVRPLRAPGRVEISETDWAPDHWEPAAETAAGDTEVLTRDATGGSRLRIRFADGTVSSPVWVTDLTRVQQTRRAVRAGPKPPELDEVFSDVAAAEKFFQLNLERQKASAAPAAFAGHPGSETTRKHLEVEGWEDYLDRCAGRVGGSTFAFSFGLPMQAASPDQSVQMSMTDWDDDVVGDDSGLLEGDTAEDANLDENRGLTVPQLANAPEKVRARYRAVARRMIHDWVAPEPQERLLALRSALLLVAGGAWDHTDEDWRPLVLQGVERLPVAGAGSEYLQAAGSLGLLALLIVQNTLSTREPGLVELHYHRTVGAVASVLIEAEAERITEYADGLARRFPGSIRPQSAFGLLERLTSADDIEAALEDLADRGTRARRTGRIIDLEKRVPNPHVSALLALAVVEKASPIALRCASLDGKYTNILWRSPDLVVIESLKQGAWWTRHYQYKTGSRPSTHIHLESRLDPDRCLATTSVKDPLPPIALELLSEMGLAEPSPPG